MFDATALPMSPNPQKMIRQLTHLVEINLRLNSTLELEPLLQYILDTAADLLECEAVSILLYDEQQKELKFAAATGSDPKELAKTTVPLDTSIAGAIFTENAPLVINDIEAEPRHFTQVSDQIDFDVQTLLGVPMLIHDKAIGVIEALNKRDSHFTYTDTKLLSIIAAQAAVAINNAKLVQALQDANQKFSQADTIKAEFMTAASRALSAPLDIVLDCAASLQEDARSESSDRVSLAVDAAVQLQVLLEDMGNINLLNANPADLQIEALSLQNLLQDACEQIAPIAALKNERISFDFPDQPVMIHADPQMGRVFRTLLINLVRFTLTPGDILIRLRSDGDQARIEMQSNQVNIPADRLAHIFDEFWGDEDTRQFDRLGLAVARILVENHGGQIWMESETPQKSAALKILLPKVKD